MAPMFLDAKRARLDACQRQRVKPLGVRQSRQRLGFATVRVESVTEALAEPAVYSLEVQGTHTFITSYGLLVHNCIPIDPLYLSWKLKSLNYTARFIELADSVNSRMPEHVVSLVADALNDDGRALNGASVLILGVAYKPDTNDVRESPALDVIATLLEHKARVSYHDPYVASVAVDGIRMQSQPFTAETLRAADCVVITANHAALDWSLVPAHARLVVDTRNALRGHPGPARVVRL